MATTVPAVTASHVRVLYDRLRRRYGPLDPPPRRDPLEELVLTVLSQNTSDVNRDRAFAALRERFPTWEDLAAADPADVAAAIRPGGLANIKAPRLLAILREISDRQGGSLSLAWMSRAKDEEVVTFLTTLPGVGPKTAACVLAFSLERPALPVDTHVFRVAKRLGLLSERADAVRAHDELHRLVSPRIRVRLHVAMIRHGRVTCRAGRPQCQDCPVNDLCPTAPLYLGSRTA